MSAITRLDWDSEFFGLRIGFTKSLQVDDVAERARAEGYDCVYIETASELDAPNAGVLVLADERVRLRCDDTAGVLSPPSVRPPTAPDIATLEQLIEPLVPWSRFSRDQRFGPDEARRMYREWLRQAVDGKLALGLVGEIGQPVGFITVSRDVPCEIGLVATVEPGKGHGAQLVEWAKSVASPHPIEVLTQAANSAALALYTSAGFAEQSHTFAYHLWVSNP